MASLSDHPLVGLLMIVLCMLIILAFAHLEDVKRNWPAAWPEHIMVDSVTRAQVIAEIERVVMGDIDASARLIIIRAIITNHYQEEKERGDKRNGG